jgi:REP-associated tyrosine transposase
MSAAKGKPKQLQLHLPTWGGRRKRKPRRGQREPKRLRKVPHRRRPALSPRHPVLVTWRVLPHVWNLRSRRCFSRISRCFSLGRDRFGFRLVHFSVQGNHLHLVVEADDEKALARGMQGLGVRIAKALNRVMGRKGAVFADHYHSRILRSPTEVANALAYVLMNFLHHFPDEAARSAQDMRDPFSSAWGEERAGQHRVTRVRAPRTVSAPRRTSRTVVAAPSPSRPSPAPVAWPRSPLPGRGSGCC